MPTWDAYSSGHLVPSLWDLHMFYLLRPILFRTCRYFTGLCSSNIPRYFLDFALNCIYSRTFNIVTIIYMRFGIWKEASMLKLIHLPKEINVDIGVHNNLVWTKRDVMSYILVKIANYALLYWWMNNSYFRSIQLLKEWPWHRKFGKSLIIALLPFSSVRHIPYYINFRFNNRPNMSSILACFLCKFVILEACSCLKNGHDTINLVSHWYQLDCLLVWSVIFRITSSSGLIMG